MIYRNKATNAKKKRKGRSHLEGRAVTFLVGDVGVVTWLAGVVGDVTVMLVGAGAGVLLVLLVGTEGFVLSEKNSSFRS